MMKNKDQNDVTDSTNSPLLAGSSKSCSNINFPEMNSPIITHTKGLLSSTPSTSRDGPPQAPTSSSGKTLDIDPISVPKSSTPHLQRFNQISKKSLFPVSSLRSNSFQSLPA